MATARKPEVWLARQKRRLEKGRRSINRFPDRLKPVVKMYAYDLLGGTISAKRLRELDHPYARRHGRALLPVLPINVQTGKLRESMRVIGAGGTESKPRKIFRLQFFVPYAKYVLALRGTKYMLPRRFWPTLTKKVAPHLNDGVRKIREAIKYE